MEHRLCGYIHITLPCLFTGEIYCPAAPEVCMFLRSILDVIPKLSVSFFGLQVPGNFPNNWQTSPETEKLGKGRGVSAGEVLSWPLTSVWGRGAAPVLDAVTHHVAPETPENPGWAGALFAECSFVR